MGKLRAGLTTATALALAACNPADAKDKSDEPVKLAEASYQLPEDQMGCLRIQLETQTEIEKCMRDVTTRDSAERQAEIAELDTGLKQDAENLAERDETIADQEAEADRLDNTYEVLIKEIEDRALDNPTQ